VTAPGMTSIVTRGPRDKWRFNVGGSLDNPDNDDLNSGDRSNDIAYWGNVTYDINQAVQVGLELSYWDTEYKGQQDGDSLRVQMAMMYRF